MPIVIKPTRKGRDLMGGGGMDIGKTKKKTKKKDPFRADKTTSLNREFSKRTAKANQEAMKNVKKKAKGGDVGKILDRKVDKATRKRGGSISEKEMIKIMLDAGKKSGLFKKAKGGSLKPLPSAGENPGLRKLPTEVRNKMGYMKKGGKVMKMRGGGAAMRGVNFKVM